MDAILTDRAGLSYSEQPPVLIAASSDAALGCAVRTVEAAGLTIGGNAVTLAPTGEMAEWSMAVVLKTTEPERVPGVRIPLSPPTFAKRSLRSRLRLASRVL